ncbi:MAG: CDP-diacylglycerol--glycerol-3-phosphate 3-phosphatidyltransferase [Deltaproteobacteria bacterium]|nr:CDP-diacylglycerol--glycerol-3-phosphate 3-phosphatidyltransferase [Deltaproteobacteria bacterium]MBW2305466.1 CDP-diacylglycerol--glycerol-3-phosphate 3-phosphatidyltransferase [Deltaproteobacteria bacterium]
MNRFLNDERLPNCLTCFRILVVPGVVICLLAPGRMTSVLAAVLFMLAGVTDFLDGVLARRYGNITNLGKLLDPLADKLLVVSALIMLAGVGRVPAWMVVIIVARELLITGLRAVAIERSRTLITSTWLAKYKMVFQMVAVTGLLLHYQFLWFDFHAVGIFFLWAALVLTVWSGADYLYKFMVTEDGLISARWARLFFH